MEGIGRPITAAATDGAAHADRLQLEELASEAETTTERIGRLVEIGAIAPAADGTFARARNRG